MGGREVLKGVHHLLLLLLRLLRGCLGLALLVARTYKYIYMCVGDFLVELCVVFRCFEMNLWKVDRLVGVSQLVKTRG